jgi:hypothetical protein
MSFLNEISIDEITIVNEESVDFNVLMIKNIAKTAGVYGSLEVPEGKMMKPGWNLFRFINLPSSLTSVSIWMTEGGSIARGGYVRTVSVQLDKPTNSVRILYHWDWKEAKQIGAQCIWSFA